MSRIVSVWLKSWPIARLVLAEAKEASASPADPVDPFRPLVLVAPGPGGARLVALNKAARANGLMAGELLSNARSKARDLQSREADPSADTAALTRLALWGLRYTPVAAPWDEASGADGFFLDITGCAHLFGGEANLLADLATRLRRFGLFARLAVADTAGASWALARYGDANGIVVAEGARANVVAESAQAMVVAGGAQENAIRDLPLAALRLPAETLTLLRRLGFRRVRDLMQKPRAPLTARFGAHTLLRLDQALGRAPEPLSPANPPPRYHVRAAFAEPIMTEAHVAEAARRLLSALVLDLERDGAGARKLRLLLFRVDAKVMTLDIGLAAPSRDAEHLLRLIALRLDRLASGLDADFGFEAAALHVIEADPMPGRQSLLYAASGTSEGLACLIDSLQQRLGAGAVRRLHPYESHIPERAVRQCRAADATAPDWRDAEPAGVRPLLLLARPEPADVVALLPEGPPRQFRWRGVLHQVAHAEGPERIAPEWWRQSENQPDQAGHGDAERDYYAVEDATGRRFWLYRAGLYRDASVLPRWFVHGIFA